MFLADQGASSDQEALGRAVKVEKKSNGGEGKELLDSRELASWSHARKSTHVTYKGRKAREED